jgi:hypothetical protein
VAKAAAGAPVIRLKYGLVSRSDTRYTTPRESRDATLHNLYTTPQCWGPHTQTHFVRHYVRMWFTTSLVAMIVGLDRGSRGEVGIYFDFVRNS